MKYGRLVFGYNSKQLRYKQHANIGDIIQTFAIDEIYRYLGISSSDIVNVGRQQLCSYDGEDVLLPFHGWFGLIKGWDINPLSEKIHPVFIGYHCVDKRNYNNMNLYRENSPVFCRDENTFQLMQSHNISSFLTGCYTLIFKKRSHQPKVPKVFMVDSPAVVDKYLPEELRNHTEYISHETPVYDDKPYYEECNRIENIAHTILDRYRNEATLVVTSRLHCAAPCIAMGIPVILVRDGYDERFSWIEKLLPLYFTSDLDKIDWNPSVIDIEDFKNVLIKAAASIIKKEPDMQLINEIHSFYMNRTRIRIHTSIKVRCFHWLHGYFPKTTDFIREVLLKQFTIVTNANQKQGKD